MPVSLLSRTIILIILLFAFWIRTYQLDSQALRGDESATVLYAALPVGDLWELSRITDPHPPLYYLMLNPWQRLFGREAWMMRFAGVSASLLAVAVLHRLSYLTLQNRYISLLAALFLAISPLQIWQAQDVRSYPLFTLFGLLSTWPLWVSLHAKRLAPRTYTIWCIYIAFTVISFYTHYYTVFLIAFQGVFVLLNAKKFWHHRWVWLASQITIGILIIPGLQLASNFIGQAAGGIDALSTAEILRRAATALLTGFTVEHTMSLWATFSFVPMALLGLIMTLRRGWTVGLFWVLYFLFPVAGVIALSIDRPFFKERFLIQAQPAFVLLLAIGFVALWNRLQLWKDVTPSTWGLGKLVSQPKNIPLPIITSALILTLLSINALALTNYFTDPAYAKAPPWYLYHDFVTDHAQPGDVMLTNFPEASVSYYQPDDLPFFVVPDERDLSVEVRLDTTRQIAGAYDRIWFLPLLQQGFDEEGAVLSWLDRHGDRIDQVFFPSYNINLYLSPQTVETLMQPQQYSFEHGVNLRGYQVFDDEGQSRLQLENNHPLLLLEPEQTFNLSLYWQAEGPTATPYTAFVQLIAADGFYRTGHDNQPVWNTYPTVDWQNEEQVTDKYSLTIPEGTPPGDHQLHVGWYATDSGERIMGSGPDGTSDDKAVLDVIVRVEMTDE